MTRNRFIKIIAFAFAVLLVFNIAIKDSALIEEKAVVEMKTNVAEPLANPNPLAVQMLPQLETLPGNTLQQEVPDSSSVEIDASQFVDPAILNQKVEDTEVVGSKRNDSSSGAGKNTLPDYYITVNKATNTVTVYKYDEKGKEIPVKAMVCSVGRAGHDTPEGDFRTYEYYDWRLMVDNTYGRYAVRFNGSIMFHSVPYFKVAKDSLEWEEYNKLGEKASLGCVRLCVADAKWIYSNCKKGTKVKVYSDPKDKGPLGKPTPIKIDPKSKYRDWDPTDLTRENPLLVTIDF